MIRKTINFFKLYGEARLRVILLLGFSSGLPLMLTFSTLTAWLSDVGVEKTAIGLFGLVGIAYSFNYLWAPLVDHIKIPFLGYLGRRRSWMLFSQICLMGAIMGMAYSDPATNPWATALFAVCVAFASATQDIVIDAYRTEILDKKQYGEGAAVAVFGYRIGMLVAGAGALFIADHFSWEMAYKIMASSVVVGMGAVIFAKEPKPPEMEQKDVAHAMQEKIKHAVIDPFTNFMQRKGWWILLLFILCSKLSDAFAGLMINPFLLEIGFSKSDIAEIGKIYGFIATTVGTIIGAAMIRKLGIMKSLWVSIICLMLANLVYITQAKMGADLGMLTVTITVDNLSAGMAISTVIAFMMSLCNIQYTATQYALLSSLAGLGRTTLATGSGWVADTFGWEQFFMISAWLGIPALLFLALIPRFADVEELERNTKPEVESQ